MHSSESKGKMVNCSIKLGEFVITYKPRPAIKAQSLIDFIVECTIPNNEARGQLVSIETEEKEKEY